MNSKTLIHRYLIGDITEPELKELELLLENDSVLRREFALNATIETGLREIAFERTVEKPIPERHSRNSIKTNLLVPIILVGLAASLLIGFTFNSILFTPKTIATLISSENASWESSLPTTPGSELVPGTLNLKSGIATLQFSSGAEVMLEAPASLILLTSMRGKLVEGTAVMNVPEQAVGFVIETPDGYVVDYGTQFAVRVSQKMKQSDFELIKGEIVVHHPQSGKELRLTQQGKTVRIAEQTLVESDEDTNEQAGDQPRVIRIGTRRRTNSVHREGKTQFLHRDLLSVKKTNSGRHDQYSFFSFDLSEANLKQVDSANLRLNLVHSNRGYAARLPKINRFAIYGLTNQDNENWEIGCEWNAAPKPEDGVLLGTFEIPRSQQRGTFSINTEQLQSFINSRPGRKITFILVRETTQIEGFGPGLTHTFASASHPEAVGPTLEFSLRKD
ncbi:MAG: iron dicitrate transport regulator FecR [Blastopirellula sp.]|nr:MAG: iron dicitrate transport regulator FecR [Blastopirellula sp.]